jgi:putative PIN family toxin of toxin-antitoxin system
MQVPGLAKPFDAGEVCCAPMPDDLTPPSSMPSSMSSFTSVFTPADVVIDTQVVMDWLVFKDTRAMPLVQALDAGRLRWIGQLAMLEELRHVLGRGIAASYSPDLAAIEQAFATRCVMIDRESAPAVRLVCRDKDDQKFIDLAIAEKAAWLISRDRAVLALAKRARAVGLEIATPEAWLKKQQTQ